MKINNKTCICCGKKYTFCTGCGQFDNEPRWKAIYHNETCKDIFIIVSDFLQNAISKEDAKERLMKCDLSYKDQLHKNLQNGIDEILGMINEVEKTEVAAPENVVLVETKENDQSDSHPVTPSNVQPAKMKYYNNKKRRKN